MNITIKGYTIAEELHHSPNSLIYRGTREEDQTPVVIKILNQDHPSAEDIARFQYEYKIIKELDVPGVIRVYDLEKVGNKPAIIMEENGGRNLSTSMEEDNGISLGLFFEIAPAITKILGEIHHHDIIHRDINPSNILRNPETGEVKIIDFALSTKLTREQQNIDVGSRLEGSLPYISPEQTGRMNRMVDYRADFYSLGVTFYELLTGSLPFNAEDKMGWVYRHMAKTPPHPGEVNPAVPGALAEIVLKLMSKNVEDRYQSSHGLLRDLEECREQWQNKGTISDFTPGRRDVSEKFQVSQKLYGREKEMAVLLKAFEDVTRGNTEFVLVSGGSGMGKSVLVNEVRRPIIEKKGYFIEGKFDQVQQDIPYSAAAQAFRGLVRQLQSEPEERLAYWKERLTNAFGPNGRVILDIIPEVEQIAGKQPPLRDLNPDEAQNRLLLTFCDFIRVFTREEHPLVIFLDNLQWCDRPTLTLLHWLLESRGIKHLLLIGAFREDDVNDGHPLLATLEEIQKFKPVRRISLKPLEKETVSRIVADTLFCEWEDADPLGRLIHHKTNGNYFFVKETLQTLYREGLLNFDREKGRWTWDLEKIEEIETCDNVVEWMIRRLEEYPAETRASILLASCIGDRFDLETLGLLREDSQAGTLKTLWEPVHEGIVIPLSDNYRLVDAAGAETGFQVSFKFQHSRVRQAAYAMIEEGRRKEVHLVVGRYMMRHFTQKEREENIIDIAAHLNEGRTLIGKQSERIELAQLNLAAGKKAKSSNACRVAYRYLEIAVELLAENPWEEQYELTFEIFKEYSECCFLCSEFEKAEELSKILLNHAKTKLEKAEIHKMHLTQYTAKGELTSAIDAGLAGLALLGISMTAKPGRLSILRELTWVKKNLRNRNIAELANQPLIEDAEQLLRLKILIAISPPAYISGNKNLYVWSALKQTHLALLHGNCPESAYAYAIYGALSGAILKDFKTGFQFGKLALDLCGQFDDLELKCKTLFVYAVFIHSWNRHWKTLPQYLKKAMEAGYRAGDLLYMGYSCRYIFQFDPELDLNASVELGKNYLSLIAGTKYYDGWAYTKLTYHFQLNLLGLTRGRLSLSDDTFDETACLEKLAQIDSSFGTGYFNVIKADIALLYEDYRSALDHVEQTDKVLQAMFGQTSQVFACLTAFFAFASLLPQMPRFEKRKAWKRLKKEYNKMKRWAHNCPENFQHHRLLMAAEMAMLSGKIVDAQTLYHQAVEAAQVYGFLRYEAFANERAAKFYQVQGLLKFAGLHMKEAHYCYKRWGAEAKVRHLEENYRKILAQKTSQHGFTRAFRTRPSLLKTTTSTESKEGLDFGSIVKAARTLSGEMNLEKLLEKLIRIAGENAGAEKAFLILLDETTGQLLIQAESTGDSAPHVKQAQKPGDNEGLSTGIVSYVERTLKNVVLGDAAEKGDFTGDPYIKKCRPKSVLCMPIVHQNKLVGILYLENNVTRDAFTPERLEVLDILASQAAISIRNADLYGSLEKKVIERTQELEFRQYALEIVDEIVRAINTETAFEDLLQAILREIMVVKGVERAVVLVRDMETGLFRPRARAGYQIGNTKELSMTHEEMEERYTKGSFQFHEDVFVAKKIEERPYGEKIAPAFGVPKSALFIRIRVEDRTEAFLLCFNMQYEDAFDDQDIFLLKDLKEHIVAAFQKTRLITRLHEAKDALEKKHQHLKETQGQLVQSEKMASLGTMVAGVAHEINNPTNFVHGSVHNLERDLAKFKAFLVELAGDDADHEVLAVFDEKFDTLFKHLSTMREGTTRIKDIVKALRTFSRHSEAEMEAVRPREGLETTAHLVKANYKDHVTFVYDFRADPEVECHIAELNQVFMNIMVNACQAIAKKQKASGGSEKGTLTIQTGEEDGYAVIRFEDTGIGMPEAVKQRMFDPFFTTKPVGEGTGLGLSVSYGIIQEHRGRIEVDSTEGKGTVITLYLPLKRENVSTTERR